MARYFKYKTLPDLLAENARLGIDMRAQDDLRPLSQPVQVQDRVVGNRWCIHPMEGCDGETDGRPGDLTFRRYRRFGDGGAKLIWGEACAVNAEARANPRQIWLNSATAPAFGRMVEQTREAHRAANGDDSDLLFGLQLTHSGRYCFGGPVIAAPDPLLIGRYRVTAETPLISDDALARLVDDYVATARLAKQCGFDFVDIKQCHRYLLSELLGAHNRPGRYGGSFENRTRLAREIITAIRAAVPGMMIATRMNAFDAIPFTRGADGDGEPVPWSAPLANGWGMSETDPFRPDLSEPIRWIAEMQSLGVAMVNVTLGNPYAQPHFGRPFEYPPPDGYESPEHPLVGVNRHFEITEAIQKAVPTMPIVGTGYSYLQEFLPQVGAANLAAGRVTFVGVGRATLAQPDWVRQLREHGRLDRKRVCRTFSYCTAIMREKRNSMGQFATGCPPFDKEAYGEIWSEVQQLNRKMT
jgi:NADPH2 dehydrogenase